jgi:hypothetical protein
VASAYGWVTIEILSMVKRAHPLYSNTHFSFFLGHLCFFACGEGRRRVCGLPESLWRQLNNHHHHHQGFLSGARVQFHLPTGVESSIHRYAFKSLHVNVLFP